VDEWKMKTVEEAETGAIENVEEFSGSHKMKEVLEERYLGDIVSSDGRNHKNMVARKNKGIGIVNQIMTKLEDVCFGRYYFKVAVVWRNTYLISSLLTNAEAWYCLTKADVDILESVDESLLRTILEAPVSTPIEMLYLELGVVPIRFKIEERRLNFLWYILHEDEESLISMFLQAQMENPVPGDWAQTCIQNLEDLNITMTIRDIKVMPEQTFRRIIKEKTELKALEYLNHLKGRHSKVMDINHQSLNMQLYLEPNEMNIQESKFLFALRSRMVDVRANYREKHFITLCPGCKLEEETQEHLLRCINLQETGTVTTTTPEYQDLFSCNLHKQVKIARILRTQFKLRNKKNNHSSGPSDLDSTWSAVDILFY
jgi:hypothetical protein